MKLPKNIRHIVGIDEAGRGPIAGPVAVGAFCITVEAHRNFKKFSIGIKDSKQLSEKAREEWFEKMREEQKLGRARFAVSFASAAMIDRRGIVPAIRHALLRSLQKFECSPSETLVLLDGGLRAPKEYLFQETIIKGDETEPLISLASIAAKVSRDRKMILLAQKHPEYGFEKHKGYGTKKHYEALSRHGILEKTHRVSFLNIPPI